jgi:anti-anti-sigma regulatory factor
MNITTEQAPGTASVTIMKLTGELDASSYLDVIAAARQEIQNGVKNLLLDLGEMKFMSSAGLVALHSVVMLLRGEAPPNPEEGWSAIHAISHEVDKASGFETHLKLLNPLPRVSKTLAITGFDKVMQVFTDRDAALASFSA